MNFKFRLTTEQAQFIFNVLAKYPYGEVADAINILRNSEEKVGQQTLNENSSPKAE